jgi:RhtB (resistance to homoserine/threonine) family protein
MSFWPEFLTLATAHALAVASPGPDFALVLRQSLAHGRRTALWTSVGIGCGIGVHVSYCLLGLGFVLTRSATVLLVAQYLGAAYLAWLGVQALRARPRADHMPTVDRAPVPTDGAAWTSGFLVNVLNPKAALFFLSLFPLAVSVTTPKLIQAGYGAWMAVTTTAWFSLVAVLFTKADVRAKFLRHGHWIDRALGVVFLGFAASLALATVR